MILGARPQNHPAATNERLAAGQSEAIALQRRQVEASERTATRLQSR